MLATQLCLSITRGEEWLGFQTTKCDVLYLQLEVPPAELHERLSLMTANLNGTGHGNFWLWNVSSMKIDTPGGKATLEATISKLQPNVLVLDPVYKLVTDTNAAGDFIDTIDTLKEQFGLSIIMVHHPKKGEREETWGNADDMLGDSKFLDWADTVIRVARPSYYSIEVSFDVVRHARKEIGKKHYEFDSTTLGFVLGSGRKI